MSPSSVMGMLLKDGKDYLKPAVEHGTPTVSSRVIDILYQGETPNYILTTERPKYNEAQGFQETFDRIRARESNGKEQNSVDRIYLEQNWPFARNSLCRKFIKTQNFPLNEEWNATIEDVALINFQKFLQNASKSDPNEISYVDSASQGRLSCGKDRLIFHFGFDWVTFHLPQLPHGTVDERRRLRDLIPGKSKPGSILLRRTCIAAIIRMQSTEKLRQSPLCSSSWSSNKELRHRRTVILFNEFHPNEPMLQFSPWLGPQECPELWKITEPWNIKDDNELTAVQFIHQLTFHVWSEVLENWREVARASTSHVRTSQKKAFEDDMSIDALKDLARDTWKDIRVWATLQTLLGVHQKMIRRAQRDLETLAKLFSPGLGSHGLDSQVYTDILDELEEVERQFSDDLTRQGQSTCDMIFNLMSVANAEAAQAYSIGIGRITWISFIFFPLIAVSGLFGMNVDILADNPSFTWYFVIAAPSLILVLGVTLTLQYYSKIRNRFSTSDAGENQA